MRVKLTQAAVDKAKKPTEGDREIYWDTLTSGFGLQVTASGHRSFIFQYRHNGRSRRMALNGAFLVLEAKKNKHAVKPSKSGLEAARREAEKIKVAVKDGRDPLKELQSARAADSNSVRAIAEEFFTLAGKNMRSIDDRRAVFRLHIFPKFGARPIDSIRRSEISKLLDTVAHNSGPVAAAHVLVALRRLFNWFAGRDDDFLNPISKGMGGDYKAEERDRVLADDELRVIWKVASEHRGPYDYLIQYITLTASRLRESADMNRSELNADGTEWTIPAKRYKTAVDHLVPLSQAAKELLARMPIIGTKGLVFTNDGKTAISGFSKYKKQFDARVLAELRKTNPEAQPLPRWTSHDLRRSARTLMARAGVPERHAEAALGHVVGGVAGVYNRFAYKDEKAAAFQALANLVSRIIDPQANVVSLRPGLPPADPTGSPVAVAPQNGPTPAWSA